MKLYTHDEMMDSVIGKKGTPRRDKLDADLKTFLMGEAIKKAREERHLTQEQLGNLIGVKKSQVSRMERGANLSFSTMARVFKAMNISAYFSMPGIGKVALWYGKNGWLLPLCVEAIRFIYVAQTLLSRPGR